MKLDKKKLIYGGVVLLVGAIAYFLYKRKGSTDSGGLEDSQGDLKGVGIGMGDDLVAPSDDERFNLPIKPNLNWIENKRLASYIGTILKRGDENRLRSWVTLIKKAKDSDPTTYPDSDGLTGQDVLILHALYQMQKQTNAIISSKKKIPATHTMPDGIFNNTIKFAFIDAQ
tara:strand:+ start:34 stop:546 length:513 start_codon:yes stop_codon:yes gene_type:complete